MSTKSSADISTMSTDLKHCENQETDRHSHVKNYILIGITS
jgi:hypothetical protein